MPGASWSAPPSDARILVLRLSALGDLVFALPAIAALRHALPRARVDWLVEDRHAELLAGHPLVDERILFPRSHWRGGRGLPAMARHLRALRRRGPYDVALDLQSNLKSALHLPWIRADRKVGLGPPWSREGAHRFVQRRAAVPPRTHRSARDLAVVRAAGISAEPVEPEPWPLPEEIRAPYRDVGEDLALLHVTTTAYGRDKEWPPERWSALARALAGRGLCPRVLWTPADRARAEAVAAAAGAGTALAPATPGIRALMALTDRARILVGTDSGPAHLAALRGTPVVALFGPTDPEVYAPPGPRVRIVYAGAAGEPPPPRDRSRRSPWMERIAESAVAAAVDEMLAASASAPDAGAP